MHALTYFLVIFAVVAVAGAPLLGWSHITRSAELKSMLRNSTLYGGGMVVVLSVLLTVTMATCTGNILYGMRSCSVMSSATADLIILFNLIGYLTAIIMFFVVILVGAVMEIIAHRRARSRTSG